MFSLDLQAIISHRGGFDVSILSSVMVGEIPLPDVGIVLPFWVQLVSPGVKPEMQKIRLEHIHTGAFCRHIMAECYACL